MERRRLGRTGHESSVAILGGAAFWNATPAEAETGFARALARGVNHLDIAPRYGAAEDVVGPLIPAVRDRLFIGCKTGRANADGVREQLETSMRKLGVDQLDLYQLHGVTTLAELDRRAPAAEAILRAKQEGLTRFVGITGHDLTTPAAQLEALRRWDLDTVMFPVAPRFLSIPQYADDAAALLDHCATHDVGVQVIKAVSRRPWGEREPTATTWYEPYTDPAAIERGIRFALSTPGVHGFATPGELGLLDTVFDAADAYAPMDPAEREAAMLAVEGEEVIFPLEEKARRA
jgi:predicted aldo/keto reductase-like oxidoreductase